MAVNEIRTTECYGFPDKMVNFQGMHLKSIATDWWPYAFKLKEGCDKTCQWNGFLVDYLNEASVQMNFTWTIEYSDNWGIIPPFPENYTSGNIFSIEDFNEVLNYPDFSIQGILDLVAQRQFDFSVSTWLFFPHLHPFFDLTTVSSTNYNMFLIPSPAQWDWTFFLRPFKSIVWIVTFAIFAVIGILIITLKKFTNFTESIKWASF